MAVFNPIVITTAGISLLSQAMAGKGTLTFTSVATSTTVIPYNISNIQAMTALSGIMQTVVPVSAVLKTGNVQVSSIFSNSGVTNAYTANTIGLYAALGNGAQTLFAVAIATTPDNIPVQNDLSPSNFYYQFNIAISDTSQLTVTVPEDGSLPASVFNQMFPGIAAPGQNNDGDALVYNASSGAWGYVNTETVFTTVSGSGEFVSLQKTLADDFKQIQLFGKSVQKPTTGAQLFNINKLKELDDGVEIIDYSTGEMEISQQNNAMLSVRLSDICPNMVAGKTYYLTGETTSNNKYLNVGVTQWNFDEAFIPDENDLIEQCNFKCTTQTGQSGEIIYYKDTFKNIMIVEGSTKKPYEVYTGGEAATEPTPEYPLPITSAGNYNAESEKYEIGINVDGANLFPIQSVSLNQSGVKVDYQPDGGYRVHGKSNFTGTGRLFFKIFDFDLIPGEYSFSQNIVGENDNKSVYFTDSLKKIADNYVNEKTIVIDEPTSNIGYITVSTKNDIDCVIYVMLNVGDKSLPFEISEHKLSTLQIPNPLRGIPVDSGGNYIDAEGQQWLCDYIDRERGKYVQCVQETVLDGSEDEGWFYQSDTNTFASNYFGGVGINNRVCICDRFFSKQGINPQNVDYLCCGFHPLPQYSYYFYFKAVEELAFTQSSELKKWLSNNPTMIIYQLATPIETDLTPDQLAALNLSTYQGITNIGTDTMPQVGMAIESRGFNLAGDLAQNLIDLQTTVQTQAGEIETLQNTVQSQSSAIAENTEKLNTLGLVGYGRKIASQSGESISLASLIPEWSDTFTSGALYSVYFSVSFSEYDSGDTTFQPYILKSIRKGLQTTITQVGLPTVYYQSNSGNIIPYSCTFMIATDSDEDVSELEFHVDGNSHNFRDMTVAVYRIR